MKPTSVSDVSCCRSTCNPSESDIEQVRLRDENEASREIKRAIQNFKLGKDVFKVVRSNPGEPDLEERYSRKDKSLSQLSKRFLAEFGMTSNQVISMFEVTEKLSMFS
jgi:hypothetical protein